MGAAFYSELSGPLAATGAPPPTGLLRPRVVWSSLSHGSAASEPMDALLIKHVASGEPVQHAIGRRRYRVGPGQFICIPRRIATEVDIRPSGTITHGFCLILPAPPGSELSEATEGLEAPIVVPTSCSPVGQLLDGHARALVRPSADRAGVAASLMGAMMRSVPSLIAETRRHLGALDLARSTTRYDCLGKLNLARTYLHATTDRPVDLATLARLAGISRFQLLRQFRDCFGATPAAYHRALRLSLAREAIERDGLSCAAAAELHGFADGSSFSHAFRRAFGIAPSRARAYRPGTTMQAGQIPMQR